MASFVIHRKQNREYTFSLKADNGEIILSGEGYLTKPSCRNAIASVKVQSPHDASYDRRTNSYGKHYFVLKAANGEILGHSDQYESMAGRENGIASVKRNAPVAPVTDNS